MTVSVIIPAYNAAKWLGAAVASVRGQTRTADEIIIVDDGSSDGTDLLCREFGSDVRYVRRENGGACRRQEYRGGSKFRRVASLSGCG